MDNTAKQSPLTHGSRFKLKFNFFDVFIFVFCVGYAFVCFYPLWYVFIVSITPMEEFVKQDYIFLLPVNPDFQYYQAVFHTSSFRSSILVSIFKTGFGTLLCLLVTTTTAYGTSKVKVPGMKLLNRLVVFTMYFGGGLIPTYFLYRDIGILKTIWPLVLPMALNVGYYVVVRNYFSYTISADLEDAAMLDGANPVQVFVRIILPTSVAMLAAIGLFIAVYHWNDWYNFHMYVKVNRLQPFAYVLRRVLTDHSFVNGMSNEAQAAMQMPAPPPQQLRMATIIVACLPIMCVYPFLQKHFTKGMMLGAVKG